MERENITFETKGAKFGIDHVKTLLSTYTSQGKEDRPWDDKVAIHELGRLIGG